MQRRFNTLLLGLVFVYKGSQEQRNVSSMQGLTARGVPVATGPVADGAYMARISRSILQTQGFRSSREYHAHMRRYWDLVGFSEPRGVKRRWEEDGEDERIEGRHEEEEEGEGEGEWDEEEWEFVEEGEGEGEDPQLLTNGLFAPGPAPPLVLANTWHWVSVPPVNSVWDSETPVGSDVESDFEYPEHDSDSDTDTDPGFDSEDEIDEDRLEKYDPDEFDFHKIFEFTKGEGREQFSEKGFDEYRSLPPPVFECRVCHGLFPTGTELYLHLIGRRHFLSPKYAFPRRQLPPKEPEPEPAPEPELEDPPIFFCNSCHECFFSEDQFEKHLVWHIGPLVGKRSNIWFCPCPNHAFTHLTGFLEHVHSVRCSSGIRAGWIRRLSECGCGFRDGCGCDTCEWRDQLYQFLQTESENRIEKANLGH
ncbi:hypothetical protein TWF481_011356 [Arthrobotrys musiformis]|uniref:C2H2-type domain-containing protein n=1 Tax=Arthrobotrys musiformis TaxID=47236 RepID=A0AAV9W076_9PEZI